MQIQLAGGKSAYAKCHADGAKVAERRNENSPAFQCRDKSVKNLSPAGTDENHRIKCDDHICGNEFQPSRWDSWLCASTPALKRRAIVGLSRWDEVWRAVHCPPLV